MQSHDAQPAGEKRDCYEASPSSRYTPSHIDRSNYLQRVGLLSFLLWTLQLGSPAINSPFSILMTPVSHRD